MPAHWKLKIVKNNPLRGSKFQRGFTLVELLVVIALIGVLSTLLLANFNAARERSRDAQRKSDLRNVQTALRLYYNDRGAYPRSTNYLVDACNSQTTCTVSDASSCTWGALWSCGGQTYMSTLVKDPLDKAGDTVNDYRYTYLNDDDYLLQACLENKSDDKGKATTDTSWCSSGRMYEVKP